MLAHQSKKIGVEALQLSATAFRFVSPMKP